MAQSENTWMSKSDRIAAQAANPEPDRIFVKVPGYQPMGPTRCASIEDARRTIDSVKGGQYLKSEILVNGKVVATKIGNTWQ